MFTLKPLPFEPNALEPFMSAKTIEFHYGKHHQAYIDNLNKLILGTDLAGLTLEEIIIKTKNNPEQAAIFNNAAQVYNHDIFWQNLSSDPQNRKISDQVLLQIEKNFSSLDNFYDQFKSIGLSQFGSGWVWLVKSDKGLEIIKTANADNPIAHGLKPLIAIDVWEHSYYLDYQNKRADFLDNCLKNLLNWKFVESNIF